MTCEAVSDYERLARANLPSYGGPGGRLGKGGQAEASTRLLTEIGDFEPPFLLTAELYV